MPFRHLGGVERLTAEEISRVVMLALEEDVGPGDVTTQATVPDEAQATAVMRAREALVVAGIELAAAAFGALSPKLEVRLAAQDGQRLTAGETILQVSGAARPILTAERVALNFIQRLSGVATLTAQFAEAVRGTRAQILDTRKTTPGWRRLEKYAVACGGGTNHRFGLYDMVLIKDNHLAALHSASPNPITAAIQRARDMYPKLKLEVETDTLEQVEQALAAGADLILLDNMSPAQLREAVQRCQGRAKTEASGGINLKTVRGIAEAGVDFISVGALTHSPGAVDIGLDFA